jgi:hypothetical protein
MQNKTLEPGRNAATALSHELRAADDLKIRRITAMLDEVSDATGKQAILDPIRARLGVLKPIRPLRFPRLLFTPIEPLIVAPRAWRAGDITVPRSVLMSLSNVVRAGFGAETSAIDATIAGHKTDATQVVTSAGEALWPRAAEILAASSVPADWSETGLRPALYPALASAIAAVLRRAPQLRCLLLDEALGALETDRRTIEAILRDIAGEPAEGCAMVLELILQQAPRAAAILGACVSSVQNPAERAVLQRAMARGMEQVLGRMEGESGIMDEIARVPLAAVGEDVKRISTFLCSIGDDSGGSVYRPRIKAIRERLDHACRERFAAGIAEGLVQPLAAVSGQMDPAGQAQLETSARELRTLETVARTVGGALSYDHLLLQASKTVQAAAEAGTLTPVRQFRLIEILAGSQAAVTLYRKEKAGN